MPAEKTGVGAAGCVEHTDRVQLQWHCKGVDENSVAFRGPQNTHAEDVRVSQLRKRTPKRKIGVRFFGDDPLESDGFPAKTVKFCGPPRSVISLHNY